MDIYVIDFDVQMHKQYATLSSKRTSKQEMYDVSMRLSG